ncbi:hypothetical protein [Marinobacter sp.]|uniref:hypothetical protein n=1 Tax=Marinobacter sp. TaxID=50741 RepID=UPI003A9273E2
MFKKLALLTLIGGISLSPGTFAQSTDWGDVAGGTESGSPQNASSQNTGNDPWGNEPVIPEEAPESVAQQPQGELACGEDDPRYSQIVPILKSIKAGEQVEPLQTSFTTYVGLNSKIRDILGDNIVISSPDCSEQFIFEGVLTGKVSVPFAEQWSVINDALRVGDKKLLQFVIENTKAAPASAYTLISLAQYAPLEGQQLDRFYSVFQPAKAEAKDKTPPLMLDIFIQLGGSVKEDDRGVMAYVGSGPHFSPSLEAIFLPDGAGSVRHSISGREISNQVASLLTAAGLKSTVMGKTGAEEAAETTK